MTTIIKSVLAILIAKIIWEYNPIVLKIITESWSNWNSEIMTFFVYVLLLLIGAVSLALTIWIIDFISTIVSTEKFIRLVNEDIKQKKQFNNTDNLELSTSTYIKDTK